MKKLSNWATDLIFSKIHPVRFFHTIKANNVTIESLVYRFYESNEIDHESHVCYGSKNHPGGTCIGDSGGPIVHRRGRFSEEICLIGITSFRDSPSCDDADAPTVFTRAAFFALWIEDFISGEKFEDIHEIQSDGFSEATYDYRSIFERLFPWR